MPIKYTLTKNDMLAEQIHNCTLRASGVNAHPDKPSPEDDEIKAKATILASFASSLSWQTYKLLSDGDGAMISDSQDTKNEYELAKDHRWKQVRPSDIQEVANMNISERKFYAWLFSNVKREDHDRYKHAWASLQQEFALECDDVEAERQ